MPRWPDDRSLWDIDSRTAKRWARRARLLVALYVLLMVAAVLAVLVARGYPPALAIVVGLILACCIALGSRLRRRRQRSQGETGAGTHPQEEEDHRA